MWDKLIDKARTSKHIIVFKQKQLECSLTLLSFFTFFLLLSFVCSHLVHWCVCDCSFKCVLKSAWVLFLWRLITKECNRLWKYKKKIQRTNAVNLLLDAGSIYNQILFVSISYRLIDFLFQDQGVNDFRMFVNVNELYWYLTCVYFRLYSNVCLWQISISLLLLSQNIVRCIFLNCHGLCCHSLANMQLRVDEVRFQ